MQIANLASRLQTKKISLSIDDAVKDKIITAVDTLHYGARPLQRKLQKSVENKIALIMLEKKPHKHVRVYLDGQNIAIK